MNDDNQILNQNKTVVADQPNQGQPQVGVVGSVHKEQGPVAKPNLSDFVKPQEAKQAPEISRELREIGVEVKDEALKLTDDHKNVGMQYSGESVPAQTASSGFFASSPLTEEEAKREIKETKPTDSLRGWLLLILKNIQRMGFKEQKV